jgi:hypothetical protein
MRRKHRRILLIIFFVKQAGDLQVLGDGSGTMMMTKPLVTIRQAT